MLDLNAMVHEPHGFSASMVATGREPTLPTDLQNDACASPYLNDPADYVEVLRQRLSMTHQQMTAPPPPASANPYQEGSHFRNDNSPRAHQQVDSSVERPLKGEKGPQPIPGGI